MYNRSYYIYLKKLNEYKCLLSPINENFGS